MSSKNSILQAIKVAKVEPKLMPAIPNGDWQDDDVQSFKSLLQKLSCTVLDVVNATETQDFFQSRKEEGKLYFNGLKPDAHAIPKPHEWKALEGVLLQGEFGVAENGAIWVPETAMPDRVIPFICRHLYLMLSASALVGTMHEAYRRISGQEHGYGVFISGPSKTADIEQSLVIGAHGPLSLTVLLIP